MVVRIQFASLLVLTAHLAVVEAQQPLPRPIVLYRSASANTPPRTPNPPTAIPLQQSPQQQSPQQPQRQYLPPQYSPSQYSPQQYLPQQYLPQQHSTSQNPAISGGAFRPQPATAYPTAAAAAAMAVGPTRPDPKMMVAPNQGSQAIQPMGGGSGDPSEDGNKQKTPDEEWAEQQSRPSNQYLQNPSGGYNMTHMGISSSQQIAPNNYFGQQFQNWTNQKNVSQMPASFGDPSRMQPGAFGGYVGPNTYIGPSYANWNNLSQGGNAPGAMGSWGFSVWP